MIYGLNMLLWTTRVDDTHRPLLEAIARIGYDMVEIPVFDHADPEAYVALGDALRGLGLAPSAVTALSAEQNIVSDDPAVRRAGERALDAMIDCAAALRAPFLSGPIHSAIGVFSGAGPTPSEIDRAADVLARVAERGRARGVRLAVEPLNRFECYLTNDLASAAALCRRIGSEAGVLYDTFHAHIEEKDPAAAIARDVGSIALVHVSENDRSTPGRGQIDFHDSFRALKAGCYAGPLVVEAFGLALPELSAATRIWRRMFDDELTLAADALAFMKATWAAA